MSMRKLIAGVALVSLSVLAWALPTLQQVEAQVGRGDYAQAESMMREVVAAKPDSARAHYVYAEILAHERKFAQAVEEAKAARTIDPDVKFTDPEKFRTFEAALLRAQNPAARTSPTPSPFESRGQAQTAPARVAPTTASAGVLAERMLNSRRDSDVDRAPGHSGLFDSPQGASPADDTRPIDFGTGGNDWDSGSSDAGGGFDGGGDGGWD